MTSEISIPTNLAQCFEHLEKIATPTQLEEIKSRPEEDMIEFHHTMGQWIRNNWKLWGGGPLREYFVTLGLDHPDDMSGVIFTSFYRYLKDLPLNIDEQVAYYVKWWEARK